MAPFGANENLVDSRLLEEYVHTLVIMYGKYGKLERLKGYLACIRAITMLCHGLQ